MKITMAHGSGGRATSELIDNIFSKYFSNEILGQMEDSAVVTGANKIALTTDSFVVDPIIFPGGDIGRLCICGTVNDLLMRGAKPKYITCGFILKEGLELEVLENVVKSMAETAKEAEVIIVAGDTKVVEGEGGLFINTSGVGFVEDGIDISVNKIRPGDVIIASGTMGEHHAAILSERMGIENDIKSDNAPLCEMVSKLLEEKVDVHTLRDVTRGGLATILKELAEASKLDIELVEEKIPVLMAVKDFAGILGLDPMYMGNEGKLVAIVAREDEKKAVDIIKNSKYGENACVIGNVMEGAGGNLRMITGIGGIRSLSVLQGEGLPRIC